jgi:putative FmdB family regulatory protein
MPLYDFICHEGHKFERFLKLADYDLPQKCPCGVFAERVISPPMVLGDYPDYNCPVTGRLISGRKAHRENLARTGCRILEPGEKEQNQRRKQEAEAAIDAGIERTVEKFIDQLPSHKKEQLANEISSGVDVSVVRK